MSTRFVSPLATAPRHEIEAHQHFRLREMLAVVPERNPFYRHKFQHAGLPLPFQFPSLAALGALPFTTKAELSEDQLQSPPYGTNLSFPLSEYTRLHQTSGTTGLPLRWLDTAESWAGLAECWRQAFLAAGVGHEDRIFFAFSFGPFIGFWSAWAGAEQVGALAISGGSLTPIQRLHQLLELEATALVCTPTYALHLAEVARREGLTLHDSPMRALLVGGEPGGSIPATRARLEAEWGARVYDQAGLTEVGTFAFACEHGNLHVNEAEFIAEAVTPEGKATDEGELVLTNLNRWGSPVIRYRTGDAVRLRQGRCDCGSTFAWLDGGILGRVDDMLIVRGINVYPSAIENIVRQFAEVGEFMLEVSRRSELDTARLLVEVPEADTARVTLGLGRAIAGQLLLTTPIVPVEPGSLPRWETKARRVRDLREE